jgi:hypothetical protein
MTSAADGFEKGMQASGRGTFLRPVTPVKREGGMERIYMKRIRAFGLTLFAGLLIAGLTAGGASANPHWYECAKEAGGKLEKGCAKEGGKGGYVLREGIGKGKSFKGKGGGAILHNVIPGKGDIKIECASFKDSGSVGVPDKEFNVVATFSKCKSLGAPCASGSKKETITTNKLAGNLGWLKKASNQAGASLTSEAAPDTGYLAEFECTGLAKVRVHGAVIGTIAPVAVLSKEATSSFAVGPYLGEVSPGYTPQTNPPAFEEESVGVLLTELNGPETGNVWSPEGGLPSGQEATATNKGELLEIK